MSPTKPSPSKKRFRQGRRFYMVLALCLVVVGGLGAVTLVETLSFTQSESKSGSTTTVAEAGRTVATVPDVRTTTPRVSTTTTTATTRVQAADTDPADLFILPLSNEVLTTFGSSPVYFETLNSWRVHAGTDFAGTDGQEVKALADGTITEVYTDLLWGDCLQIDHGGGVCSLYCGVKATATLGETVTVGQSIGTLSGIPCEANLPPHLHLEMRSGGDPIDPVKALGREVRYSDTTQE